jgi:hypothetical protein
MVKYIFVYNNVMQVSGNEKMGWDKISRDFGGVFLYFFLI